MIWERYGGYLEGLQGREYRHRVFAYVEEEDSPQSLSFQINLLPETGFRGVEILHKNSCFAAFGPIE